MNMFQQYADAIFLPRPIALIVEAHQWNPEIVPKRAFHVSRATIAFRWYVRRQHESNQAMDHPNVDIYTFQ
jgi:hypothetical protein